MIRFTHFFLTLSIATSTAIAQPNIGKQVASRSEEVVALMSMLSTDAVTGASYPQMFEACTQIQPAIDFPGFPGPKEMLVKAVHAVRDHFESLHLTTETEMNAKFHQCLTRMLALGGKRGEVYTSESLEKLRTRKNFYTGLTLTRLATDWVVRDVSAGTPAAQAGMQSGDALIKINDTLASTLNLQGVFDAFNEFSDKEVTLTWRRKQDGEHLATRLIKQVFTAGNDASVVVENMGSHLYIRVSHLDGSTSHGVLNALRSQTDSENLIKVLDLRGNPGGLLNEAHLLLAMFGKNDPSKPWVATKYREGSRLTTFFSTKDSLYLRDYAKQDTPRTPTAAELRKWSSAPKWYVLIDRETASGAAWLAGSLRDMNGAVLVGTPAETNNVGVDVVRPLGPKTFVRIPVAELAFPSGKVMRANSVVPDVPFEVTPDSVRPFPKNSMQWKDDPLYLLLGQHFNSTR